MAIQLLGGRAQYSTQVRMAEVNVAGSFSRPLIIHSIPPLRMPMITGALLMPSARQASPWASAYQGIALTSAGSFFWI